MSSRQAWKVREKATATGADYPQPVRIHVEAVRVNQRCDGASPVVASIFCSPHPAALQIDTPTGSGDLASMIPRSENCYAKMMANSRARLANDRGDGRDHGCRPRTLARI